MKFPETSLGEAVAILNMRRHNGHDDWVVLDRNRLPGDPHILAVVVDHGDETNYMTMFEAISVAEKYLRDFAVASDFSIRYLD